MLVVYFLWHLPSFDMFYHTVKIFFFTRLSFSFDIIFASFVLLCGAINFHLGTLNKGHYWAFSKDLHSSSWYSCNDKLVFNVEERSVNNTASYIFFYRKVWIFPINYQKLSRFFFFFFFCNRVLSFQTSSLGVTTPYINPVLYRNWVCPLNFQALQPCNP